VLRRCSDLLVSGLQTESPRIKTFGSWLPTVFFHGERMVETDFGLIAELQRKNVLILECFRGHEDPGLVEPWIDYFVESSEYWKLCAEYNALLDAGKKDEAILLQDEVRMAAERHENSAKDIKKHVFAWKASFLVGEAPIFDSKNCQPLLRSPLMKRQPMLLPEPSVKANSWVSHFIGSYVDGSFSGSGKLSFGQFFSQLTGVISASGEWRKGKLHGTSTIIYTDGRKYEGRIKDLEFEGHGDWLNSEGRFKGMFSKGRLEGAVEFTPTMIGGAKMHVYRGGKRLEDVVVLSFSSEASQGLIGTYNGCISFLLNFC
jgi:hypothetical protein